MASSSLPVRGGEVVAGGQGVGVSVAQDPLAVGDQVLAIFDRLSKAAAKLVEAPDCPPALRQQSSGCCGVVLVQMLVQGHDLLDRIAGSGPVPPGFGQGLGYHGQQARYAGAERGQAAILRLTFPGYPHSQPVRADRRLIAAKRQQRRVRQLPERLIDGRRPGGRVGAGAGEQALLPGGVQQRPGYPGSR